VNDLKDRDITEILKEYQRRLERFKKECEELGVKVEVKASIGPFYSKVETAEDDGDDC